jgi:hypothetical protein
LDELAELRASIAEQFSALKAEIENLKREIAWLKSVFQTRDPNQPLH